MNTSQARNSAKTDQKTPFFEKEEDSDSEESKALTIKHSIRYEETGLFPDPKYMFNLMARGLTTPEKFVAWWNETHPDCQITVDSIMRWSYCEDEDPANYSIHWEEYGD
ncbi:25977_t:CDS:2 [Dentiscutata erythropus]|nr:25977_t:CDS:2 [Dentiscutata erythropus]